MEYKPIAMILSLFIIWILILGTMAATGNAQEGTIQPESDFTGNAQEGTIQPESDFTGNKEEIQIGNEHECFDEFGQLETCTANQQNGATTQESSNTGNATEVTNNPAPQNGATTQESSNTGNATEGAINPAPLQEMVPAMRFTTIQPQITTKQLANGLTEEKPAAPTNPDCNRTVCVANAPHIRPGTLPTAEDLKLADSVYCQKHVKGQVVKMPCELLILKAGQGWYALRGVVFTLFSSTV